MGRRALAAASRLPGYGRQAASYDSRTAAYERYRRMAVQALPLQRGDVVLDVGCGTGLCFPLLQERIGPSGTLVGVDAAPDMLALATARTVAAGWTNVLLIGDPVEAADLPEVDHALFSAVHDILQSGPALHHVLAHVRPGGAVSAVGGKWAPPWAVAANVGVLALHAPYVRDFAGFDRPWALLEARLPGLEVREVAMGCGFLAVGRRPG